MNRLGWMPSCRTTSSNCAKPPAGARKMRARLMQRANCPQQPVNSALEIHQFKVALKVAVDVYAHTRDSANQGHNSMILQETLMLPQRFFHTLGKTLLTVLMLCTLLLSSFPGHANQRDGREQRDQPDRRQEQPRARVSASQAAALVEQHYGGRVMNVQTRQTNGGVIYSVKILQSSGHMRTVNVDGQSGAILN